MPAYGNFVLDKGYDAEALIVKFRAVKAGATPEGVIQCSVLGEAGRGVAQFGATAAEILKGKGGSIRMAPGLTEWETGAAFAKDVLLTTDASGRCITAVTGNNVWGRALQASSGVGVRVSVALMAPHVHP